MPSAQYKAARNQIALLKKQALDQMKDDFEKEALELLYKLEVSTFSWTQYTPYFNDGDVCVFRVNHEDAFINGAGYWEPEDADPPLPEDFPARPTITEWEEIKALSPEARLEYNAQQDQAMGPWHEISNFLEQWEEEDMEFLFGDHVKVTATKNGVTTEPQEHD